MPAKATRPSAIECKSGSRVGVEPPFERSLDPRVGAGGFARLTTDGELRLAGMPWITQRHQGGDDADGDREKDENEGRHWIWLTAITDFPITPSGGARRTGLVCRC